MPVKTTEGIACHFSSYQGTQRKPSVRNLKRFSFFWQCEYCHGGVLCWNLPYRNPDHHGSFWKTWLLCISSLILPLCSADIPLKWVPSYCRCCVQISSCLWLRRKTCLKENNGLMGLYYYYYSIKMTFFLNISTITNRTSSCLVSPWKHIWRTSFPQAQTSHFLPVLEYHHLSKCAPTLLLSRGRHVVDQ